MVDGNTDSDRGLMDGEANRFYRLSDSFQSGVSLNAATSCCEVYIDICDSFESSDGLFYIGFAVIAGHSFHTND